MPLILNNFCRGRQFLVSISRRTQAPKPLYENADTLTIHCYPELISGSQEMLKRVQHNFNILYLLLTIHCHPELVSGSHEMLKRVQHNFNILYLPLTTDCYPELVSGSHETLNDLNIVSHPLL